MSENGKWGIKYKDNADLTEITIPNYITSIDDEAFSGCKNLTRVIFEDGSQLQSIGVRAFV